MVYMTDEALPTGPPCQFWKSNFFGVHAVSVFFLNLFARGTLLFFFPQRDFEWKQVPILFEVQAVLAFFFPLYFLPKRVEDLSMGLCECTRRQVPALFSLLVLFPVEEIRVMSAAAGSLQNEGVYACV